MADQPWPVIIYPLAEEDLDEILGCMKSESVKRAEQFYTSLQERLDHVSTFPELFPLCRDQILAGRGYRIIPIGSYLLLRVLADRESTG